MGNADAMSEMHDDCEIKWHKMGNSQWRLLGATRQCASWVNRH
jgi:hypothetical protein